MARVLVRYGMPALRDSDRATGRSVRRYEHAYPGHLVHVDIKKLGRIPDGGGHKMLGPAAGRRDRQRGMGHAYLHNAVDDHSRLAYVEILADEQGPTAAAFWARARAYFTAVGIPVSRVLTDNGACYRSRVFTNAVIAGGAAHKRTRPYRPQTNGRIERFNRILLEEWPTSAPTPPTPSAAQLCHSGRTTATITAATPRSADVHRPIVSPTLSGQYT